MGRHGRERQPFTVQLKLWRKDEPEMLAGSVAALRCRHVLSGAGAEAQIHQDEAPDAAGEEGAQAQGGSFLP